MDTEPTNAKEIFLAAAEIVVEAERRAYVQAACGDNGALRQEVDELLCHHAKLGTFLQSPAQAVSATMDGTGMERPGMVIGPYKLMEQIGEGGMGLVFVAEQQHPVRRKVALKVIKPGMDSKTVIARFEAERQALALMDHPHIAKVLDGGETASGRPYFVMELVKGIPITEYCDQNQLTPRERLGLFLCVCQAVQHAHQKGIIHRDIKPTNVMVVSHDGTPVVKVIDFGVAKAVGQQLTDKTIYTQFVQMVGTPLYMSPEQAGQSGLDVDTRTDIYALGVLLYELLTGSTPFDKERFGKAAFDEIRRIICEEEPPKPSTRISTLGIAASTLSTQRKSDPKQLSRLIRGELDWIVMKALEKDRNRRYETANGLARDIERYLNDETVQACPPSAAYRLRKLARRNKAALTSAAMVGAALVVAVVVLAISTIRIGWAKDRKEEALRLAETNERAAIEQGRRAANNLDESQRQLFRAKLNEARASRRSRGIGQRIESLRTLEEASQLARELKLAEGAFLELRNEVIACLALPDLRVAKEWEGWPPGSGGIDFDAALEIYARADRQGNITVGRLADDAKTCPPFQSEMGACWLNLSPDGRGLLVNTANTTRCRLFFLAGGKAMPVPLEESDAVGHAFRPDGQQMALAHADGGISLYEIPSGRRQRRLPPGPVPVHIAFDAAGRRLALACPAVVQIRDLDTDQTRDFPYPGGRYSSVAWHPDGKTLAVVGGDSVIYLWDVDSGKEVNVLRGCKNVGIVLAFNRTGDLLASNGWEGMLRLWDPRTGQELFRTPMSLAGASSLHFSPDGRLSDGLDGTKLWVFEVAASREYRTLTRDPTLGKAKYGACAVSPDGRLLAAGMDDGFAVWDCRTGAFLSFVPLDYPDHVRFEPKSGALLTNGPGKNMFRWPISGDLSGQLRIGPAQRLPLPAVPWGHIGSSADDRVLVASNGQGGAVWRRGEQSGPIPLAPHPGALSIAINRDGRWAATGGWNGTGARIWDARTGKLEKELLPSEGAMLVGFSPDGKWLATRGNSSTAESGLRLWQMETWKEGPRIGGDAFAFSPDGRLLAVETGRGSVRLVNPDTGREYARLEDPAGDRAGWLAFSSDGANLVAIGDLRALHVWDLRAIRAELAARGLDWDLPPYPPAETNAPPPRVIVDLGDLADYRLQIAACSAALALLPVNPEAYLRRGHAWYRLRDYRRAADDLGVALGLRPDDHGVAPGIVGGYAQAWFEWANACYYCQRFEHVAAAYSRSVELEPDNALYQNNLAWFLAISPDAKLRDPARAVKHANRAVEMAPHDGNVWNTFGVAYYRAGNFKEALAALNKSVELQKGGTAIDFFFLAMAHCKLDDEKEARRRYDQAIAWVEKNRAIIDGSPSQADEMRRFQSEAEEVLGIKEKKESGVRSHKSASY